jgi:mono/diheme cytochrome c family protein
LKKVVKVLGWVLGVVVALAGVTLGYAFWKANTNFHRQWTAHTATFPIPFPLSATEISALKSERPDLDPRTVAAERAAANGRRLVDTRLGCTNCHNPDFGGKAVIDSIVVARWVAPNLTLGNGSVTKTFGPRDWDLAIRHGIKHTGETSSMPCQEFLNLSDHELSDVVSYIRSLPPVDRDLGPTRIGPVFAFIGAFDSGAFAANSIDHNRSHPAEPPQSAVTAEFGEHLSQVCRGCHGANLSGGKIAADPNMPEVANLTPHETGLKDWTETDFLRALHEGKRKNGTVIADAMPWRALGKMSDEELKAIYAYLRTVPPLPKGNR